MVVATTNGAVLVLVGANKVVAMMTGEWQRAGAVPIGADRVGSAAVETTVGPKVVTQPGALSRGIMTGGVEDITRGVQM